MQAAIVGAGASGSLHALALRAAGVRVAVVVDPDERRARDLAGACGAAWATALETAISAEVSVAAVCSPPHLHVSHATALAARGRTVFVEKPVATSEEGLRQLRGSAAVPILQWRAGRGLRALRRAAAQGVFGATPTLACDLSWARDESYLDARRGWGCGALLSIGIHALDAMAWLLGRGIESVAGLPLRSSRWAASQETAACVLVGFEDGATASLRISFEGAGETTSLRICGNGTTVDLVGGEADPTGTRLHWQTDSDARRATLEALEASTPGALGSPLLVPYLVEAVRALRDGERPGESSRLPSIEDCYSAHAAALLAATSER